jgi:uncharacterized protein
MAVVVLGFVVPTLAWSTFVPWWLAVPTGALFALVMLRRVSRIFSDPRRPRWVTRLLDEPLFWQWGAGVMALPLLLLGAVLLAVLGVSGCSPDPALATHATVLDAAVASLGLSLCLSGWGVWGRRRFVRLREIEVEIANLHPDLDGYRIAHLSDLHVGSYDPRERARDWARLANRQGADLAVVTGDLVTSGTDYYEDVAEVLGELRAPDGVFVSLGNHDQWDPDALSGAIERRGPRVLRNAWVRIARGAGSLVVAGLDDKFSGRDDLGQTLEGRPEGVPTVLLSHYPSYFEEAARRGVDLVLAGHTHGGQLGIPFLSDRFNLSALIRQASRGLTRHGASALYVSAGLGTTGPPIRLGVAPEIALIVLRAAPKSNMPRPA